MSEITQAIKARQTQILQLQSDIKTLQSAASVLGGKATAKAQPKAKAKRKRRKKATKAKAAQPKATQKRKRATWSAADKAAISRRMKAYWAKRRKEKAKAKG